MKILFVAPIPLHRDASAGAETINYYIKSFLVKKHEITVISRDACSESNYIYKQIEIGYDSKLSKDIYKVIKAFGWILAPWNKYLYKSSIKTRHSIFNELNKLKDNNYNPDIVILETTTAILWHKKISKIFPGAKIVASLHDIAYQGTERRANIETNSIKKYIRFRYFKYAKKREIQALESVDLVVPHNKGNKSILLRDTSIDPDKVQPISPYYIKKYNHNNNTESHDLLFFGLMSRPENYLSAEWFINNVLIKLDKKYRFIVMGGNPPDRLKKYSSDNIIVTGFLEQDDIQKYFENSFCLVCPLLFGSGIKTKLLTAFASGIPILTNDIGIEGINAVPNENYIHCETPDDYIYGINELDKSRKKYIEISSSAKKLIDDEYDLEKSADAYEKALLKIL
jgi:glycosyltransferase involved in cell wall biosynthesis